MSTLFPVCQSSDLNLVIIVGVVDVDVRWCGKNRTHVRTSYKPAPQMKAADLNICVFPRRTLRGENFAWESEPNYFGGAKYA